MDPDGDEIADIDVSGINEGDIIQMLNRGTEFQGFATQFKSPGQYTLEFKIQDSQGLWSNVWSIDIEVDSNEVPETNNTQATAIEIERNDCTRADFAERQVNGGNDFKYTLDSIDNPYGEKWVYKTYKC